MLSTAYRLRLEGICKAIASGQEVVSTDPDGTCLKFLDIGDPNSNKKGFSGADDIAQWFRQDRPDDWRQRD